MTANSQVWLTEGREELWLGELAALEEPRSFKTMVASRRNAARSSPRLPDASPQIIARLLRFGSTVQLLCSEAPIAPV